MASSSSSSAAAAEEEPPALPTLLMFRVREVRFHALLRERYRVLDFFASTEPLPAFLSAASTAADPPRAALTVGGDSVRVDAAFLDAVPSLRFVFSTGAGLNHIDLAECARRGVAVANSGSVYSTDVADQAVGLLVDVLRRVSASQRFLRRGLWPLHGDYPLATKLGGKRVGIIGLGNIGTLIAKRLEAFGCVIFYNSRTPKESVSYKYFPTVHDLASESDVLIVACVLSKETCHIVNKDVLEALGKDGVVVNVGRGLNVDEAELVAALKEGRIAGAGLDVFEKEPKVPVELFSMDNVVLTPHNAVFTEESRSDLRDITIGNLEAFFAGQGLAGMLHGARVAHLCPGDWPVGTSQAQPTAEPNTPLIHSNRKPSCNNQRQKCLDTLNQLHGSEKCLGYDQDTEHWNNITGCFALASWEDLLPNGDINKSNHFIQCRMASRNITVSESFDEQFIVSGSFMFKFKFIMPDV